jgi:2-polyprenyl-3-methyl-5-hydroxy-6-metoxy-1,4-benzoquinol methylase
VGSADSTAREIRARYQDLYRGGKLSLSQNYTDKFPLLEHVLKDLVRDKRVLDFGCGPGRLSLMLARYARAVHGVDHAGEGVQLAVLLARATGMANVAFDDGDLDWVLARGTRYDVIVLAGVLEHLEEPIQQLAALARLLTPGGVLCVQTPSFANFRGDVYNTLGHLLGLPMTLTDLWQVTPGAMKAAADAIGLRLGAVAGGHYRLAFLDGVLEDFHRRVPNAARDAGLGAGWNWERFFAWLAERVEQNRTLIDAWAAQGALKPVPGAAPLRATRPPEVDDGTWATLEQYLSYDGWREPWYSDASPVCYYGASAIYIFGRPEDAR